MQTNKSGDGSVFGAIASSSQRSIKSIKEMFGNLTEGTSQVMRSMKEQFSSDDGSNASRDNKTGRRPSAIMESKKSAKSRNEGSKQSKRSKMDKSHQSKRGLRSGIVRDGRAAGNRGSVRFDFDQQAWHVI